MLRASGMYEMSVIQQALEDGRSIEIIVKFPEFGEDRIIRIDNLHRKKDGWGVEHIEGFVIEDGGLVRVVLHDNGLESSPLNHK